MMRSILLILFAVTLFLTQAVTIAASDSTYNPLHSSAATIQVLNFDITDTNRQRTVPVKIYFPELSIPSPVILFSHGLGGSRDGNLYLNNHWAARGYVVVCLQHPGSDTSVWANIPRAERLKAMRQAANYENFMLRVKDVASVIDQLAIWNKTPEHPLFGRMNLDRIGMSGHSFGASTTQAVGGQRFMRGQLSLTDNRIKAAMALSPNCPRKGGTPEQSFGQVAIPWLLITGTHDTSIITDADAKSRLAVFPALPPGGKYELVLDKAEHSAFADSSLPGDKMPRNPNHHLVIKAISTAFWDAWLCGNDEAKKWLDSGAPLKSMEPGDAWQKK
jgi:predicted dienelactone hydrolase